MQPLLLSVFALHLNEANRMKCFLDPSTRWLNSFNAWKNEYVEEQVRKINNLFADVPDAFWSVPGVLLVVHCLVWSDTLYRSLLGCRCSRCVSFDSDLFRAKRIDSVITSYILGCVTHRVHEITGQLAGLAVHSVPLFLVLIPLAGCHSARTLSSHIHDGKF